MDYLLPVPFLSRAGHSEQLAISVIGCKAIVLLAQILEESHNDALLSVAAWTVGQIGKHTPEHAQAVAAANILPKLVHCLIFSMTVLLISLTYCR